MPLPDFHGTYQERLDDLNHQRSREVYAQIDKHGWPPGKQSSLALAYETPEVEAFDAKIQALKDEFAASQE